MLNTWKNRHSTLLVSLATAALLAGPSAHAQDKSSEIDKIFGWTTPSTPGCTCVVSQNGKVVVNRAYGSADLEHNTPITPETIFDAGSLQKQFVAAAALILLNDGKLSLSEDIHKYIPELPDYGHKITIDNLLTHTSGIRDWTGLVPLAADKKDALTLILRQGGLNIVPGEEWSYSNSGVVLVKEIVARTSGMSFGDFTRKRMFEPLGMKSTSYRADIREVGKNGALGYQKEEDGWRVAMLLDNNRGGGGVMSTSADLITWNDALTHNKLGKFVSDKLEEPTRLNNGRTLDYGRGLFLNTYHGTREVAHTGSADGYKSYLGRFPEHGLSIAILCNSGDGTDRREFAYQIFDLYVPGTTENQKDREDGPPPPIPAGVDASSNAGLFFDEKTGDYMRLALDRGRFRVMGGPGLEVLSKDHFRRWGNSLFFMSQDKFESNFISADEFELKSMEGKTSRYRRVEPFTPTPEDLKAFAGRFKSDEIGTVFKIEPKGEGLVVLLEHSPEKNLEFTPINRDTFQFSRMTIRFHRDKAGKVATFDYGNPVVRNVQFTRLKDS